MSGYEVTVEDLRRTAGKYDAMRDDLGSSKLPDTDLGPNRVGHCEVASWLTEVLAQAKAAQQELGQGLESLAEYLRDKARDYEQADFDSADLMQRGSWADGSQSGKLTPLPHVLGQPPEGVQLLPNIYGQNGAQFSPLTPPSNAPKAD